MCVSASVRQHFRDGCVSEGRSLRLQKSPASKNQENAPNSRDISKRISHSVTCKFDPSVVSQPFPRSARLPKTRENRPEIRAFRAFGCVS